MAAIDASDLNLTEQQHRVQLRRAVIASTIGTTIEWYDFFLYSTVTGLVFAKLFFPHSDPLVGTLEAFTIYAVGFAARPVGAAIFGHYGDRIGRKATLIATLMLMGLATFAVALVPTYETAGIWGAVILTVLRFLQGIGVGGEWGGSVLMSMEWARTNDSRGFITTWPQFGVPGGLFLANLAVLAFSQMSGDQFLAWGWRIPFALSIALVGVGLYIRLGVLETPTFRRLIEERKIERTPIIEVIKRQPKEILLSALLRMAEQAPFYIFTAFIFAYGTAALNVSRDFLLVAVLTAAVLSFFSIPYFGHLSDRIGRTNMYMIRLTDAHLPRDRAVARAARHDVRAAGCSDRGGFHRSPALQRRLARLSARFGDRRRPCTAHRNLAVQPPPLGHGDRRLHPILRHSERRSHGDDARLHRQGHWK